MRSRFALTLSAVAVVCGGLASCSNEGDDITLQGAGASFPAPLYKRWFLEYYRRHPEVRVNYQPIGSGAGIRQFTDRLVDFAASDAAMSDAEIAKVPAEVGVQLLPMTAGTIALSYNVPGAPDGLKLSREAIVGIFLGEITAWDHEAIARVNPGVTLPALPITVVRRSEGSGTTFAFTNHLSAISKKWKAEVGVSKSVDKWKVGIGGKGNDGVAALIQQTPGAIGYIETGYSELSHLPTAAVENSGPPGGRPAFVQPTAASGKAALGGAKFPDNLRLFITDPRGKDAYPIVTYTWLLCYKHSDNPRVSAALKDVIRFCLNEGQTWSGDLGYVPLPDNVREQVSRAVDNITP